jgi:hypothetical protein
VRAAGRRWAAGDGGGRRREAAELTGETQYRVPVHVLARIASTCGARACEASRGGDRGGDAAARAHGTEARLGQGGEVR